MSQRQKQHGGRSADDGAIPQDERIAAPAGINVDPVSAAEDAREISRLLDEEQGFDRATPRKAG